MQDDLPFIYPANLDNSERHRLASRIFKNNLSDDSHHDRCECCGRRVGQEGNPKSCWYSPIYDLVFLGPGVPLLFVFIQNGMLVLVLLAAIFFFYSLITNLFGNSCQLNTKCIQDVFNELSISNKINNSQDLMIQTYLVAGYLLIYMVFSQHMIFRVRQRNDKCDEIINSPSDYSIIIKNLPEQVEERDIQEMISLQREQMDYDMKIMTKNLKVKKIIITYALEEYLKQKKEQQQEFLKAKKQDEDVHFERVPITKPTHTASFAIVVFDTQLSKQAFFQDESVKKNCRNMLAYCCQPETLFEVNGKKVVVERAPEPDDILWENADIPKSRQTRNIILAYFFGMLILAGGGAIQYYLQFFQNQITDVNIKPYFSTASSLIITIFNAIIIQFLIFVTKLEGRETKTDQDRSLLVKICIYSFFNAGIFYSAANILAQSINSFNIQGGFSFEITLFMSMNAITPNLIGLIINKIEFPAFIFRFMARLGCCKYTQAEANKLYELGEIDFPVKYAYVIRTVWLTCFYGPFVPVIVPISILGLIVFYFTEAQLFRSSYRAPNMLSISITRTAMRLLDFTGVVLTAGQILIVFYIKFIFNSPFILAEQIGISLCVGLSIILILLPSQKINERCFPIDDNNENALDYDEALKEFEITYEGTNPLSESREKTRRVEHNLFKFMNVADILEVRKSRSASKSTPNPLLNMLAQPNETQAFNQSTQPASNQSNQPAVNYPPPPSNQYNAYPQNNFNGFNQFNHYNQQNQYNQFAQFNQYNHMGNRLL